MAYLAIIFEVQNTFEVLIELFVILMFGFWTNMPPVELQLVRLTNECSIESNSKELLVFTNAIFEHKFDHDITMQMESIG